MTNIKEKVLKEVKNRYLVYQTHKSARNLANDSIDLTLAEVEKVIDELDKIQDKGSDWDIGHHEALEKLKQKLGIE